MDVSNHVAERRSDQSVSSPQVIVAGFVATVAPLLLLFFNSDWFFTREGYLDPWNYVGLFREYLDPDYLPEDYKLARLPWILAGFVAHSLLPPIGAASVLHAIFLCAMSLALFVGLFTLLRRSALAAVVAMWLGFYTPVHGSGGWDYHNTAAGALYLATFALLAAPSTVAGSRFGLASAGAMAALTIHTNITFVNFLPALALVYGWSVWLRVDRRPSLRALAIRAAWCLLGALVVTVVLGLINWNVGRRFLFFGFLLDIVVRFVGDPSNLKTFHLPWSSGFFWTARYLSFLVAVFLAGVAWLLTRRQRGSGEDRIATALVVQFVLMASVWIAWQSAGQVALDIDYFTFVLIPSCFIALAGLFASRWPAWCERHWLVTILTCWAILAAYLVGENMPGARAAAALVASSSFVGISALFLIPLAAALWRPSVVSFALLLATFALGNRLVAGSADYWLTDRCKMQPQVYAAIVDASSWLMKLDPLYRRVRIWFDENELIRPAEGCTVRVAHLANSIRTMAFMGYVVQQFPMPSVDAVPEGSITALTQGDPLLVVVSDQPTVLADWRRRLETLGMTATPVESHHVPVLASGFTLHSLRVSLIRDGAGER